MNPSCVIRSEMPEDEAAVFALNARAFDTDAEARLVDALRRSGDVELSLVAEVEQSIIGHLLLSSLQIETGSTTISSLALAPMAVAPEWQRRGIGSALVIEGLNRARAAGHTSVVVLGHPEFYPRFGFSADLARPLKSPFSGEAWMACELVPGALAGVAGHVRYAGPFGID